MIEPYYENNLVTLYHGDCLEIMPMINQKFDCCITDIPYFNVVSLNWDNQWNSDEEYLNWCENIIDKIVDALNPNSSLLMFTSRQYNRKIANFLDKRMKERRIIIWKRKRGFNRTRGNSLASGYEPICYYVLGNPIFNCLKVKVKSNRPEYCIGSLKDGICLSDVWDDISALPHNSRERVAHPTQKPVAIMERCVKIATRTNGIVLDPFSGSGTTGIACMRTGRQCIMIEQEEKYCEIACNRLVDEEKVMKERLF